MENLNLVAALIGALVGGLIAFIGTSLARSNDRYVALVEHRLNLLRSIVDRLPEFARLFAAANRNQTDRDLGYEKQRFEKILFFDLDQYAPEWRREWENSLRENSMEIEVAVNALIDFVGKNYAAVLRRWDKDAKFLGVVERNRD